MSEAGQKTEGARLIALLSFIFCALFFSIPVHAQEAVTDSLADTTAWIPPVATQLTVTDFEYDNGEALIVTWTSVDDPATLENLSLFELYRVVNGHDTAKASEVIPVGTEYSFKDEDLSRDSSYQYFVASVATNGTVSQTPLTASISPDREWFNMGRINVFVMAVILASAVMLFIRSASKGKKLFVRKIAGLEAVDDAIGRATEMGRPILFIPGIQDMDDVQTLAGLTILGRIAEQVADYDTKINMPVSRSLVMTAGRETIKAGYQKAGRPDAYNDDMVNYITDEQFGYVAAVDGIMVREKPATIFLLGAFFAESLVMAETGNSIGAIQIAGTARPAQLPFFIAACDFTLIGEELFAASAYLSGEVRQLGSLKGQDVGKAIAMIAIVAGVLFATFSSSETPNFMNSAMDFLHGIFSIR